MCAIAGAAILPTRTKAGDHGHHGHHGNRCISGAISIWSLRCEYPPGRTTGGVTIEGVETFEQLRLLALKVKPDLVQGFLFGSALTASGIETMSTTVWPFASELKSARRAAQR